MLYQRKEKSKIDVDLSPLIDVVFLLLIFFMVSTQFKDDHGMDLSLPSSESRVGEELKHLTIVVDKDGAVNLAGERVEEAELEAQIRKKLPDYKQQTVVLKVDKRVSHGQVVSIMDAAKTAGAEGLTFATMGKAASGGEK